MRKIIESNQAPKAIGPYAQACFAGDLLFISGQLPIAPDTGLIESNLITDQTHQCFKNVETILSEAGQSFEDVVKVNVYLKNMDDFNAMNEVYGEYFNSPYPARVAVEVSRLPKDALIEIEVVAYYKQ